MRSLSGHADDIKKHEEIKDRVYGALEFYLTSDESGAYYLGDEVTGAAPPSPITIASPTLAPIPIPISTLHPTHPIPILIPIPWRVQFSYADLAVYQLLSDDKSLSSLSEKYPLLQKFALAVESRPNISTYIHNTRSS